MKQKPGTIANKRARFDYDLKDSLTVGLVLSGAETKALRLGQAHLRGAYVNIKNDELWLINATIVPKNLPDGHPHRDTADRKLLAKKREIEHLLELKKQGLTIVPVRFLTRGRFVKLEISAGRGKKHYDKRQTIKKRDTDRDTAKVLKRAAK